MEREEKKKNRLKINTVAALFGVTRAARPRRTEKNRECEREREGVSESDRERRYETKKKRKKNTNKSSLARRDKRRQGKVYLNVVKLPRGHYNNRYFLLFFSFSEISCSPILSRVWYWIASGAKSATAADENLLKKIPTFFFFPQFKKTISIGPYRLELRSKSKFYPATTETPENVRSVHFLFFIPTARRGKHFSIFFRHRTECVRYVNITSRSFGR